MNSDSDSSDDEKIVSEKIKEVGRNVPPNVLPEVSKQIYIAAYNAFELWRKNNGVDSFREDIMLSYFDDLSNKYKPSSLWSVYSMLKTTLNTYDQVDISGYQKLISFLKKKNAGYEPNRSKVFTKEHISKFLREAPDEIYLSTKVALIFGIAGALRRREFRDLKISDVKEFSDMMLVRVFKTTDKVPRSFTITGGLYDICKKYKQVRPKPCSTDSFFIQYANKKCTQQSIGINKFGTMPKDIALYLNLPDADKYTGHSFRRTSATRLFEAGADISTLKRHGIWESNSLSEEYNADSPNKKKKSSKQISPRIFSNQRVETGNAGSDSMTDSFHLWSDLPTANQMAQDQLDVSDRNSIDATNPIAENSSTSFQDEHSNEQSESEDCKTSFFFTDKSNTETPSTSDKIQNAKSHDQRVQPHATVRNITVSGNSIIETSSTSEQIQRVFIHDSTDEDLTKSLVFYNCNVTIEGGSHRSIVFNNCTINK